MMLFLKKALQFIGGAVVVILAIIAIVAIIVPDPKPDAASRREVVNVPGGALVTERQPISAPPPVILPAEEQSLINIVAKYAAAYHAAPNDMAKGGTRPARAKEICNAVSLPVQNWRGKIEKLSSNSDGHGVLAIRIAPKVVLKTTNNSFGDSIDHTLIQNGSPLYQAVVTMREGQSVRFSGTFIQAPSDCFQEMSMSVAGAMEEPEFSFRFSEVTRID